jgi:hypothetical protein
MSSSDAVPELSQRLLGRHNCVDRANVDQKKCTLKLFPFQHSKMGNRDSNKGARSPKTVPSTCLQSEASLVPKSAQKLVLVGLENWGGLLEQQVLAEFEVVWSSVVLSCWWFRCRE